MKIERINLIKEALETKDPDLCAQALQELGQEPEGEVVLTHSSGSLVAVTRQNSDGEILSVIYRS